jgi:hypothetical protein
VWLSLVFHESKSPPDKAARSPSARLAMAAARTIAPSPAEVARTPEQAAALKALGIQPTDGDAYEVEDAGLAVVTYCVRVENRLYLQVLKFFLYSGAIPSTPTRASSSPTFSSDHFHGLT